MIGSRPPSIEQVVILGAGFDSRAYRLSPLAAIDIFEVDHPDTPVAKQDALKRVLSSAPKHVRFVPVNFEQNDLASLMKDAGYCESKPTLFLWEGITNYLTADAVDSTLRWCSNASAGSRLVFTYVHRDILTKPSAFVGSQSLFPSLERAGERFTFGIEPSQVPEYLAGRGHSLEVDIGAAEYRAIYYGARAHAMRGHEFYRVALARVGWRTA